MTTTTYELEAGGQIRLGPQDYVTEGGQARIFVRAGRGYKVFARPTPCLPARRQALATLHHPRIVVPQILLLDRTHAPVGYAMHWVQRAVPWARASTTTFWQRESMTPKQALSLVRQLLELVQAAHAAGLVIADLSLNNVLLTADLASTWLVDTDSWQTPTQPAAAITPTILDPLADRPPLPASMDFFALAVIAFELLVGVHPYKGKHPKVKGLAERMQRGLSAFDPGVTLPPCARALSILPPVLSSWCREIFAHRHREPPPPSFDAGRRPSSRAISSPPSPPPGPALLGRYDGQVLEAFHDGEALVVRTPQSIYRGDRRLGDCPPGVVATLCRSGAVFLVRCDPLEREVTVHEPGGVALPGRLRVDEVVGRAGAVFVRTGGQLSEIRLLQAGQRSIWVSRLRGRVLPHSAWLGRGVALWTVLGSTWGVLLEEQGSAVLALPELDGRRPLDAVYHRGVLAVLSDAAGRRDLSTFVLAACHQGQASYVHRTWTDVSMARVELCVDEQGRCAVGLDGSIHILQRAAPDGSTRRCPRPARIRPQPSGLREWGCRVSRV